MVSISVWGGKQRVQGVAENCHADAEKIQAQKVELPIPGVMIAPDHAEQKQRIRNAADTAQPGRCGFEIKTDLIQNHAHQRNAFEMKYTHRFHFLPLHATNSIAAWVRRTSGAAQS